MILPGEFKLTSNYISDIISSSDEVVLFFQQAIDIAVNKSNVQQKDFRFEELIGGMRLSANTMYNSIDQNGVYALNLFVSMANRIKNQYGITLDQFLEEQFIEISKNIYDRIEIFAKQNPTERFGDKYARWQDIDVKINEMNISKYSNLKMYWSFIGATNDN